MSANRRPRSRAVGAGVALVLLVAACGGGSPNGSGPVPATTQPAPGAASADGPASTVSTTTTATDGLRTIERPVAMSYVVPDGAVEFLAPRAVGVDTGEVQISLSMPTWYADFSRPDGLGRLPAAPVDVGDWLSGPALPAIQAAEPLTLGGVRGLRWLQGPLSPEQRFTWADGDPPLGAAECLAAACLPLFGDEEGFYAAEDALSTWLVALDLPAGRMLIAVTDTMGPQSKASPRSPEQLWATAQPFLDTVRFGDVAPDGSSSAPAPASGLAPAARRLDAGR